MREIDAASDSRTAIASEIPIVDAHGLPRPTVWPVVLASAIPLLLWGLFAGVELSIAGFVLLVVSIAGWVQELRRQQRAEAVLAQTAIIDSGAGSEAVEA